MPSSYICVKAPVKILIFLTLLKIVENNELNEFQ